MNTISPINRTYAPVQALVDELARCGMTHAVTCPGSRNAPVSLSLAAEPGIATVSVIDERSAGFVALGLAKASGRPVAVTCTSGTAAANLAPAVAEAREARVPLIVLTADRPPELRDTGAGQAIDQVKLYGDLAVWFAEAGNHDPGPASNAYHRSLGCRAFATAQGPRPGPVHINLPLREPLAPSPEELTASDWQGRPGGAPWTAVERTAPGVPEIEAPGGASGVIVCGPAPAAGAVRPESVAGLAERLGWPILAEPTSGLRFGPHDRSRVVSHYDSLLRHAAFATAHRPDAVLRIGDMPTSKPLRAWVGQADQVVVDPHAAWHDPGRSARSIVVADPTAVCEALAGSAAPGGWLTGWLDADARAGAALAPTGGEPAAYTAIAPLLADGDTVWVASSMPIRDVETFFPGLQAGVRFLSNRGANGIDGTVSSALGASLVTEGRTWVLTGELALLHDLGGLAAAARAGAALTIVCVNNGGGGIFDFLPVAGHADTGDYEAEIATPSGLDLGHAAAIAGLEHTVCGNPEEIRAAAARGPVLAEIRGDRDENVRIHADAHAAVAAALG